MPSAFPFEERPAGRPVRTSPLYPLLEARGARFGARGGWERAVYFDPGRARWASRPRAFAGERNWFDAVGPRCGPCARPSGCSTCRRFTKLAVEGPGAVAMLDRLLCTRLPRLGRVGLAYALNERGRIVSEFTVTRLGEERFYLCSAASAEWHDEDLLAAARPGDGSVRIDDLTARFGTLVLAGPRARDILAPLVDPGRSRRRPSPGWRRARRSWASPGGCCG